jgi:hypothetical protein
MSTKNLVNANDLVALKIAVIKYHGANEYTEKGIARDACYTSFNSLQYKLRGEGQMADVAAEIKDLIPQRGQEIADVKLARLLDRYEGMETELAVLQERHNADLAAYKQLTGEEWLNKPRRTHTSTGLGIDDRLKRFG